MYNQRSFRELPIEIFEKLKINQDEEMGTQASMRKAVIPSNFLQADPGHRFHEYKSYKFQLPKSYLRDKSKKSSFFRDRDAIRDEYMPDTTDVEIFELIPVDYLDKMSDEKAVLKEFCQNAALQRIEDKVNFLVVESRPYVKKYNLT